MGLFLTCFVKTGGEKHWCQHESVMMGTTWSSQWFVSTSNLIGCSVTKVFSRGGLDWQATRRRLKLLSKCDMQQSTNLSHHTMFMKGKQIWHGLCQTECGCIQLAMNVYQKIITSPLSIALNIPVACFYSDKGHWTTASQRVGANILQIVSSFAGQSNSNNHFFDGTYNIRALHKLTSIWLLWMHRSMCHLTHSCWACPQLMQPVHTPDNIHYQFWLCA